MLKISASTASFAFDPTEIAGYQQSILIGLFCDTLVRTNIQGSLESGIAKSWSSSTTGDEYHFMIDPTARFHDGRNITSRDVSWSLSRHFASNSKSIIKTSLGAALQSTHLNSQGLLNAITLHDEHTFSITLKGPYPPFLKVLSNQGFCILPHNFDKNRPVGSGPYELEKLESNSPIIFKSSKNYFQNGQHFERISIQLLKLKDEIFQAFNSRSVDIAMGIPFADFDNSELPKDAEIQYSSSLSITSAFLNMKFGFFSNRNEREDFASFIRWIKNQPHAFTKYDRIQESFLPKGIMPAHYYERNYPTLQPEEFFTRWRSKLPREIKIGLSLGFCTPAFKKLLIENFKKANISPIVNELKGTTLLTAIKEGDFDIILLPYAGSLADPDSYLELLDPNGILKSTGMKSKPLMQALEKARFNQDPTKRLLNYEAPLRAFEDEFYVIPLAQQTLPILYRKGLSLPDTTYRFHTDLRHIKRIK